MKLDVIFSTFNGANRLARMLHAFGQLRLPEQLKLSIIAVDNASTDRSVKVLRRFESKLPLKILSQPEPGKGAALNLALAHSRGDLVVFTDDDILPHRDWLWQLISASDEHTAYDLFAGSVVPDWPRTPPARLLREVPLGPAFALTEQHVTTGPCDAADIQGNNMAVRRYILQAGHRFDATKGLNSDLDSADCGSEFMQRCQKAGHKAFFVKEAVVEHRIHSNQLTLRWLRERGHQLGRKHFHAEAKQTATQEVVATNPSAYRRAQRKKISYRIRAARLLIPDYRAAWKAGFYAGYLRESQEWSRGKSQEAQSAWQASAK